LLCLGESLLHGYGTLDCIDDTGELGQNTIPRRIGDASAILSNQWVHDLAMGSQGPEGSDLILLHEPRVTRHVSREDGCQPSLNLVLLPVHGSLDATQDRF
jgi:hypothetical protein